MGGSCGEWFNLGKEVEQLDCVVLEGAEHLGLCFRGRS